jgi:hypothetical protein
MPIEGARSWINCAETSLSGVYEGSMGENHFFVAESNLTRNTPLPSWTDEKAMYLPFRDSSSSTLDIESTYQARTKYFTAEPQCKPLSFGEDYHIHLWVADSIHSENTLFNVTVPSPRENKLLAMVRTRMSSLDTTDISVSGVEARDAVTARRQQR